MKKSGVLAISIVLALCTLIILITTSVFGAQYGDNDWVARSGGFREEMTCDAFDADMPYADQMLAAFNELSEDTELHGDCEFLISDHDRCLHWPVISDDDYGKVILQTYVYNPNDDVLYISLRSWHRVLLGVVSYSCGAEPDFEIADCARRTYSCSTNTDAEDHITLILHPGWNFVQMTWVSPQYQPQQGRLSYNEANYYEILSEYLDRIEGSAMNSGGVVAVTTTTTTTTTTIPASTTTTTTTLPPDENADSCTAAVNANGGCGGMCYSDYLAPNRCCGNAGREYEVACVDENGGIPYGSCGDISADDVECRRFGCDFNQGCVNNNDPDVCNNVESREACEELDACDIFNKKFCSGIIDCKDDMFDTEQSCNFAGCFWTDDECRDNFIECEEFDNYGDCTALGCLWSDDTCHDWEGKDTHHFMYIINDFEDCDFGLTEYSTADDSLGICDAWLYCYAEELAETCNPIEGCYWDDVEETCRGRAIISFVSSEDDCTAFREGLDDIAYDFNVVDDGSGFSILAETQEIYEQIIDCEAEAFDDDEYVCMDFGCLWNDYVCGGGERYLGFLQAEGIDGVEHIIEQVEQTPLWACLSSDEDICTGVDNCREEDNCELWSLCSGILDYRSCESLNEADCDLLENFCNIQLSGYDYGYIHSQQDFMCYQCPEGESCSSIDPDLSANQWAWLDASQNSFKILTLY